MRNFLFASLILGAFVMTSCNNERVAMTTVETLKTQEMRNFDNALRSLMKPENRATPEEKAQLGAQLNERSLNLLYNASKQFLSVEGEKLGEARTRQDKEIVISKATKLYFTKLGKINETINNEK